MLSSTSSIPLYHRDLTTKKTRRLSSIRVRGPGLYDTVVLALFCVSLVYFSMALAGTGPGRLAREKTAGVMVGGGDEGSAVEDVMWADWVEERERGRLEGDTQEIDTEVEVEVEAEEVTGVGLAEDATSAKGDPLAVDDTTASTIFSSSSPLLHAAGHVALRSHHGFFHHRILAAQAQLSDEEVGEKWWRQELQSAKVGGT